MAYFFNNPERYILHMGADGPFDPKELSVENYAHQKLAEGKQQLADALNIQLSELPDFGGELHIVQLQAAPSDKDLEDLQRDYGLSFNHPYSDISYLEKLTDNQLNLLNNAKNAAFTGIRAVVPYWPELKVHKINISSGEFIIGLLNDEKIEKVRNILVELGADPESFQSEVSLDEVVISIKFNTPLLHVLIAYITDVVWVEGVTDVIPQNLNASGIVQSGNPANLSLVEPPPNEPAGETVRFANAASHPIWAKGIHGENQIIGVIDLGDLDLENPFLIHSNNQAAAPSQSHRKVIHITPRPSGEKQSTHGMNVVGCLIAGHVDSDNHQHRGGAWASRIVYADSRAKKNDLSNHLGNFKNLNAYIVTRSLSTPVTDSAKANEANSIYINPGTRVAYSATAKKIDKFLFENEKYIFFNASPNSRSSFGNCGVVAKNSVVVGGVQSPPTQYWRTDDLISTQPEGERSNTADNRRKPDILAVSQNITTTDLNGFEETISGNTVARTHIRERINGNSFAAPHLASAAALVREYFIKRWYPDGRPGSGLFITPNGTLIKAVLLNATVPLSGLGRHIYPYAGDGWGRLQLNRTLFFAPGTNREFASGEVSFLRVFTFDSLTGLKTSNDHRPLSFNLPRAVNELKVTLVFNDYPGEPNSDSPPLNKLSIELFSPPEETDGMIRRRRFLCNDFNIENNLGFTRSEDSTDISDRIPDRDNEVLKDNVRQILLNTAEPGEWTLHVWSHHVHSFKEGIIRPRIVVTPSGYSIVISGKQP